MGSPVLADIYLDALRFSADGLTDKQIGRHLYLTESGVKYRIGVCLELLGANTRAQAVAEAHRRGLLSRRPTPETPVPQRPLTEKQQWLIALFAEGLTYGQIAARYSQSEDGLKVRVTRIRRNVGARNCAHLVHLAHIHGLLPAVPADGGERR